MPSPDRALTCDPVPSPCVSVCTMSEMNTGDADQLCTGCLRTIEEIIAWGQASEDYKRAVWVRIAERSARLSGKAS